MLDSIPALTVLLETFRPCFTTRSYQNFCLLLAGSVLAQGRRTVTEMLRVTAFLGPQKHFSSYHRFWSRARWSSLHLARVLTGLVVARVPPEAPLLVAGDDTTERRSGANVYGVGCHRDPVRSTRGNPAPDPKGKKVELWIRRENPEKSLDRSRMLFGGGTRQPGRQDSGHGPRRGAPSSWMDPDCRGDVDAAIPVRHRRMPDARDQGREGS